MEYDYTCTNENVDNSSKENIMKFDTFLEYILDEEDYNVVIEKNLIEKDLLEIDIPESLQRELEKYINQDYSRPVLKPQKLC